MTLISSWFPELISMHENLNPTVLIPNLIEGFYIERTLNIRYLRASQDLAPGIALYSIGSLPEQEMSPLVNHDLAGPNIPGIIATSQVFLLTFLSWDPRTSD